MADLNSRTPAGVLAYCDYLTNKGYAGTAQINPWRTAIQKIFETVEGDGWESVDLAAVDLDDYFGRFQTLAGAQYKAESVTAYKRRVVNAIDAHRHYLDTGRPPTFKKKSRTSKVDKPVAANSPAPTPDAAGSGKERVKPVETPLPGGGDGLVDYPFPTRAGAMAHLRLPAPLDEEDAERLTQFIRALVFRRQAQLPASTPAD